MLLELAKAAVYIFPFIKELFLGKAPEKEGKDGTRKNPKAAPEPKSRHLLRQTLITVAMLSVIVNVTLIQKLFTMGSVVVALKKEVAVGRQENLTPPVRPTATVTDAQQAVNTPTPQELEAQTRPPENVPSVPSTDNYRYPEVLPPRDEHQQAASPPPTPRSNRRAVRPVTEPEEDRHYHRLRRIDEIR